VDEGDEGGIPTSARESIKEWKLSRKPVEFAFASLNRFTATRRGVFAPIDLEQPERDPRER